MSWKKIRKDAGEITVEDLLEFPSWTLCLGEEGVEGQTECTMRPFKGRQATLSLGDDCQVGARFHAANGKQFVGWVSLGVGESDLPRNLEPEIFLASIPERFRNSPLLNSLPAFVVECPNSVRLSLHLPIQRVLPDEKVWQYLEFAYGLLQTENAEATFPMRMELLQPVFNFPSEFLLAGFCRPSKNGVDEIVR